jgi:hypothetical protein
MATAYDGIYRSTDGGTTLTSISAGLPAGAVYTLTIDPIDPSTLYAGTDAGVSRTTNAGVRWAATELAGLAVTALAVDPKVLSTTVFAGAFSFDGFVTRVHPSGSSLVYSTFLGGHRADLGFGVAVDATGSAHVTGFTSSTDFPTANPLQSALAGVGAVGDASLSRLSPTGSALVYSTYLGGSGDDLGRSVAVDAVGNAYVTGRTSSRNFPTANALQPVNRGGNLGDAFVTKVNTDGKALVYSTFLGGSNNEDGIGIALDSSGNAYVVGTTGSDDFRVVNPLQQVQGEDAFIAKIADDAPASDIDVMPTSLDFGNVPVGDRADRMLNVRNVGGGPLTVSAITSNNPLFSLVSPAVPFTVAPGGEQSVTVRFMPAAGGAQQGALSIINNDVDEAMVIVQLRGEGVTGPEIDVSPTTLDFGSVSVGQAQVLALGIRNLGGADLTITGIAGPDPQFSAPSHQPPFVIAGGRQETVTVRFAPNAAGAQAGALTIQSNDADEPAVTVQVRGAGVVPDLLPRSLMLSKADPRPGDTITVSFSIENQGQGGVGSVAFHDVRLSNDRTITTSDTFLTQVPTVSVPPGALIPFSLPVRIPSDTPVGTMFLGVIADASNLVTEASEDNNTLAVPLSIGGFGVVGVFPRVDAVGVPLAGNLEVEFSAALAPETVSPSTFRVTTAAGQVRGSVVAVNSRAFFFPNDPLPPLTTVQVRITTGVRGIVGATRVPLASEFQSSFTTESSEARNQPPSDGRSPVRYDVGGTIQDGARTAAAIRVLPFTLKSDAVLTIEVQRAPQAVSGFAQVSDVVRLESQP